MASTNAVIAKLESDFAQFKTDASAVFDQVKAFITSVQSGSTSTKLSDEDAAALADIDASVTALDTAVTNLGVPKA